MTNATNKRTVTADLPDYVSTTIPFVLVSTIAISSPEVFPGKTYTMSLNSSGIGSLVLPTPDGTGVAAWLWQVQLQDGRTPIVSLAWNAGKLFPRADRAPTMQPHKFSRLQTACGGRLARVGRISAGFYTSDCLEYRA
jgi:hypothetical protein